MVRVTLKIGGAFGRIRDVEIYFRADGNAALQNMGMCGNA